MLIFLRSDETEALKPEFVAVSKAEPGRMVCLLIFNTMTILHLGGVKERD